MRYQTAVVLLSVSLIPLTGCADLFQAHELSPQAATQLTSLAYDSTAPVTVHGRVTALLFPPPGGAGMLVLHAADGPAKYAFSTAPTPEMSRQGFTRFSLHPGEEITVTGLLAQGGQKLEDYAAARADRIATADGKTLYTRAQ